jgi:hypothetical protein
MRTSAFTIALIAISTATAQTQELSILLPLYSYPNWYAGPSAYQWDDVATAAAQVNITAIINPNSGPDGGPPNSDFVRGMSDLAAGGVTMLGYVATGYGNTSVRPLADIKFDIDLYDQHFSSHGISGIFLDEASNDPAKLSYYSEIYTYIQSKPNLSKVFTNPGVNIPEPFITTPTADNTVIFENTQGWANYTPDEYIGNHPSSRFSALMLNVPTEAGMRAAVDLAVQRNIGYVYVTDDTILAAPNQNPFDRLPTYWTSEVSYVASVPEPASTAFGVAGLSILLSHRRRKTAR